MKNFSTKKCIFFVFLVLYLFHYRVYFYFGMTCSLYVEFVIAIFVFLFLRYSSKPVFKVIKDYLGPKFCSPKEELNLLVLIFIVFMILGCFFGTEIVENVFFYRKTEKKYGMVYSYELLKKSHSSKIGYTSFVRSIVDSTLIEKIDGNLEKRCLISYPKLRYDGELGYYSIYHKKLFEKKPTDIQIEYCKKGARLSEKINNLKKYSGIKTKEEMMDYIGHVRQHDNRVISAIIERRGEKYTYANALQSNDKLWAVKYRNLNEGKRILIIYDLNDASLFSVINWNPSEYEYEYYNTKEGKMPSDKYLCIMDSISKRFTD